MSNPFRSRLLEVSVVALLTGCGGGGESPVDDNSLGGIVDAAVAAEMKAQGMPGMTVAIARNGVILYTQGYGYADLNTHQAMPADAVMQIGSVTKQFTATAILQLQDAGLLDIDRTVVSYLPNYAFDPRITLRMLLNQTSGLQDYITMPSLRQYAASGVPESTVLNAVVAAPLLFDPGSAFNYSNSNYYILGSVIEAVSSQTYADYLAARVFSPAGLNNTSYLRPAVSASPYAQGSNGPVAGNIPDSSAFFAAGQLWSNVQDLALWDAALLNEKVIPRTSFNSELTPAAVPEFKQSDSSSYGMGWVVGATVSGHPFIWHNGGTGSYTAFNGLLTDDGFSVTVLTNYDVNETPQLLEFGQNLVQAICNAQGC
jgi:CubicO group peptidase (beta-lactamase class C family)